MAWSFPPAVSAGNEACIKAQAIKTWVATVGDRWSWQNPGTEKRQSHSISSRFAPTKLCDKVGRAPVKKKLKKVAERGARKSRGPGPVYPEVALGKPALDGSDEVERLFCASAHRRAHNLRGKCGRTKKDHGENQSACKMLGSCPSAHRTSRAAQTHYKSPGRPGI